MSIYQFLIAVRTQDGQQLMNDAGETTRCVRTRKSVAPSLPPPVCATTTCSHLQGLFSRTIRMVENDLKPCYVFDGKPPALKSNVVRAALRSFAAPSSTSELTRFPPVCLCSSRNVLLAGKTRRRARKKPRRLVRRRLRALERSGGEGRSLTRTR